MRLVRQVFVPSFTDESEDRGWYSLFPPLLKRLTPSATHLNLPADVVCGLTNTQIQSYYCPAEQLTNLSGRIKTRI